MTKKKLQRFAEMETFDNVIQPSFNEVFNINHSLKGKWNESVFCNKNSIILELGCGKGEYTTELASKFKDKNFIGVDIKGSRIWRGAKTAKENDIKNVRFLRTHIELINSFFDTDEVQEIWVTFPDPQLKKKRKRLTSSRFLKYYEKFLTNNGVIHLKTDNDVLYNYTLELVELNELNIKIQTNDLYNSGIVNDTLNIKTFYEKQFLSQGLKIKYICFELPHEKDLKEPEQE